MARESTVCSAELVQNHFWTAWFCAHDTRDGSGEERSTNSPADQNVLHLFKSSTGLVDQLSDGAQCETSIVCSHSELHGFAIVNVSREAPEQAQPLRQCRDVVHDRFSIVLQALVVDILESSCWHV